MDRPTIERTKPSPKTAEALGKIPTQILIVDDHTVVIEGIKAALEHEEDFEVVGTATGGLEAVERVKALNPDIVILDYSMPGMDGCEAVQEIRKINDRTRIIIFSMHSEIEVIISLMRKGISGYVAKARPISELVLGVKVIKRGGTFYSKSIQRQLQEYMEETESAGGEKDIFGSLSGREKELFVLLADGLSIKEIADRLCISPKTVETHKYNIMEKLDVRSIAQLTKIAVKRKLINI